MLKKYCDGALMQKKTYLSDGNIKKFIEWLSPRLDSNDLAHSYLNRQSKLWWNCVGLFDAFKQYRWPAKGGWDFQCNARELNELRECLNSALQNGSDQLACEATVEVMHWGGVVAGNVRWLRVNQHGLAQLLMTVKGALDECDCANKVLTDANLRFNAGMTKVYSLLCNDFLIYDSRVAAALGWLVVKYCKHEKLSEIPKTLRFPWAPAKESDKQVNPKCRNPNEGNLRFPRLQAGPMHAEWNLKASWLLKAVLEQSSSKFNSETSSLRALEASLFMIGYDLAADPCAATTLYEGRDVDAPWVECFTLARRNRFEYRLNNDGVKVRDGVNFSDQELNLVLSDLWIRFRKRPFPLSNNATRVRSGEAEPGLGSIYFEKLRRNPPDTSKLAAILEDIALLNPITAPGRRELMWTLDWGRLDLNANSTTVDIRRYLDSIMED